MNTQPTHPDEQALIDFGLGKLPPDDAQSVEDHVSDCPRCCETLLELGGDTFVHLVRRAGGEEVSDDSCEAPNPAATAATLDCGVTSSPPNAETDGLPGIPEALADHPRYRIIRLLGRGGMGDVYLAEHRLMNRQVALKLIHPQLVKNPQAVERFRREVQAAARLSHPNIVAAYDAEQAGDTHILAMEYVDGIDLEQLVRQQGPLPVPHACSFVCDVAEGLQHASQRGMVHRDIKPSNLMVTLQAPDAESKGASQRARGADGSRPSFKGGLATVKILDFGLASLGAEWTDTAPEADAEGVVQSSRLTASGTMMGTPDYVAPEQLRDASGADIRSDIYALGCTLYYLLAGRPPFDEGSVVDKLQAHTRQEAKPLSELRGDVPPRLGRIVRRMMAKDPAERFQTPAEVSDALAPFAQTRRKRLAPKSLVAAGIALVAAALLAVVFYVQLGKTALRFEIADPNLRVRFGDEQVTVDNQGDWFTVKPGDEQKFTVLHKGVETQTDSLTLRRGQDVSLRVSVVDGRVAVVPNDQSVTVRSTLQLAVLQGHTHWVWSVAASPDGKLLASAGHDAIVRLWDVATRQSLPALDGHNQPVFCVAFSPDGKTLATSSADKTVRLWNVAERREIATFLEHTGAVRAVAFSPDGDTLASGGADGVIRLWDVHQRKLRKTLSGRDGPINALAFLSGRDGPINALAFSPQGDVLASAGKTVRLWDADQGNQLENLAGHDPSAHCVAFSPDGATLATGGRDRTVKLWDARTGEELDTLAGHTGYVYGVAFSPDGRTLASGSWDRTIRLWDLATRRTVEILRGHENHVKSIAFLPDGQTLASSAGDNTIRLWHVSASAKTEEPVDPPPS